MLASIFSLNVIQTALELGCIYALVALALFLSYSILNIADLSTDGCFTLGCAVACQVALTGHPFLALLAAMAAGVCSGFITAFLQTRLGVESIMAGIIVNTGLYTINLAVMGFSSTMSLVKTDTVFSIAKSALSFTGGGYKLVLAAAVIALAGAAMVGFLGTRLGLSIRATGDNAAMVRASSINPAFTITVGLCISGALTALSGGLLAQYQKSCDINVGTGMVTIALASLIIGETLVGKRTMVRRVLGVVFGSCLYRFIVAVALRFNVPAAAMKLVSAIIVLWPSRCPPSRRRSPLRSAAMRPVRHGRSVCKMEMLELRDLHKTFNPGTVNEKVALNGVSLTMEAGDFATIVGSNGAGKSTLFNAITGGFIADEGSITLGSEDITFAPEYQRSRVIGHLFQDPLKGTAPNMTIEENLALAYLRAGTAPNAIFSRISRKDKEIFREKLALLDMGLEDRMKQPVGLLSGGQRQALTLLMATLVTPKLLLLDEHTAALDPATAEKVLNLTKSIVAEKKITCLMVTHNMHQALELGNRTLMMDAGRIVFDVKGEARSKMTVDDLLEKFRENAGKILDNDRILLSKVEANN